MAADMKPKKIWGLSDFAHQDSTVSNIIQSKTKKKNLWDIEAQAVDIQEIQNEQDPEDFSRDILSPPTVTAHKTVDINDLNKQISKTVPSSVEPGIDLSCLTSLIRPVEDLIQTDMQWDYKNLQTEISRAFREKFGDKSKEEVKQMNRRQSNILARLPTIAEAL